ncbi:DUF4041 domain-containing protein [Olsenella uli]|uniref:DUF4041 domain-containing protein n=1 Tax=Olsenella uli TaxID=133926 RepID=UPI0028E3EDED|nr:DUF4041 domain-containing protein [Olsenella uli]
MDVSTEEPKPKKRWPRVLGAILLGMLALGFLAGIPTYLATGQPFASVIAIVLGALSAWGAVKLAGIHVERRAAGRHAKGAAALLHVGKYKGRISELEAEVASLREQMTSEMRDAAALARHASELGDRVARLDDEILDKGAAISRLDATIADKERQLSTFDDKILVQEFGLYEPRFDFANSSQFKDSLDFLRARERDAVKEFNESLKSTSWTVNNSKAEGKRMVSDIGRLLMRAYNGECDQIVSKVKYTNVHKSIEQIRKHAESVNKFGRVLGVSIPGSYVDMKVEEVQLAFEYARQKEREREELREAREQEREAKRLAQEIAAKRRQLQREQEKYAQAYAEAKARIGVATNQERADLEAKIAELEERLGDVRKAVEDVDYREANTKAGYVYVISNVGSFGEDVYKIGMTRRLDPMERVRELGDASVPFNFDVHALIFSDDAPALEAALHRAFEANKVNLVNQRREFFRVTLEDIERVVKANYDRTVEFAEVPDAEQWRESVELRKMRG